MLLDICLTALLCGTALAIWPIPTQIETGTSPVWISKDVKVTYNGGSVCWISYPDAQRSPVSLNTDQSLFGPQLPWNYGYTAKGPNFSSNEIVAGGVARAIEAIVEQSFTPWMLYPRNQVEKVEPAADKTKTFIETIEITQSGQDNDATWKPKAGEVDESYTLCVETDGKAKITAVSSVGVLRALESFTQLFFKHSEGGIYSALAPVDITDKPTFPHRGILLDVARNWYPVESITHTLDAMSWNKMNRLHIHVTDSQSWPLEIPALPDVAKKGAYGKGLTYSPEDITHIQSYAVQRGIEVIFEIDMPGHIGIVAESYPDIIAAYNAQPWTTYCAEPPCGQFQLNNTKVDEFLDKLMEDLLPRLSPYTAYFHQGGDEFNFNVYNLDPTVGTNDTEVLRPLLQKFTDRMFERVKKAGLNPIVWEEIPTNYNITIGKDVVVQSWLGGGAVENMTKAGHQVIDSNYNFWVRGSPQPARQG